MDSVGEGDGASEVLSTVVGTYKALNKLIIAFDHCYERTAYYQTPREQA